MYRCYRAKELMHERGHRRRGASGGWAVLRVYQGETEGGACRCLARRTSINQMAYRQSQAAYEETHGFRGNARKRKTNVRTAQEADSVLDMVLARLIERVEVRVWWRVRIEFRISCEQFMKLAGRKGGVDAKGWRNTCGVGGECTHSLECVLRGTLTSHCVWGLRLTGCFSIVTQ